MDDLLNKIKTTENDAKKIVQDAEEKAEGIIDKANLEARRKTDEAKKTINQEFQKIKQEKIDDALGKKTKIIEEKMNEFLNNLGDIESKKEKAAKYLAERIKEILK